MIIRFSARASRDLSIIFDYGFEHFGDDEAEAFTLDLERRIRLLIDHPEYGKGSSVRQQDVRQAIFTPYTVEYRLIDNVLEVIKIVHQRSRR